MIARDLTEPSPLALEILAARPYAYLDDAPLEERRTQAVMARRWIDAESAGDLGKLDAAAIERVREEVWPEPRSADELHDALMSIGFLSEAEIAAQPAWRPLIDELAAAKRATRVAQWDRPTLHSALLPSACPNSTRCCRRRSTNRRSKRRPTTEGVDIAMTHWLRFCAIACKAWGP